VPAVSIPGVRNWKPHYDRCFTDYERVFVFADGDQDGKDFAKRIRSTLDGVTVIQMPDGLDVNGVYQAEGPDGLRKRAGL
jgi:DNA primase